jgi:LysR family transcriptional regulator, low CO2-responsive transcriptional regulator
MAVTVTQLVAFLTVVRTGSVTAAANELIVTQPSVSAAINALQRELGVILMNRSGRNLELTPAGEAYVPYAAEILGLLQQGSRAARESVEHSQRTLRLGAVMTAGEYIVAPLLRVFRQGFPELEITLHVGNREQVFQRLVERELDVAITGSVPPELPLESRAFAANEFVLIAAPGEPLARRQSVTLPEVAGRPWLLREPGSGTRALCEAFLAAHEVSPSTVTLGSNGAIKQAVGLGLGVALQSRCAVGLELELGLLSTIRARCGLPQRAWYVAWPATGPVRGEVAAFADFVVSGAGRGALARASIPTE